MKTVTVYLEEQQIERLDNLAERTRILKSEHIRQAVTLYLDNFGMQHDQKEKYPPTITLTGTE